MIVKNIERFSSVERDALKFEFQEHRRYKWLAVCVFRVNGFRADDTVYVNTVDKFRSRNLTTTEKRTQTFQIRSL
jgi:hypothetical protein